MKSTDAQIQLPLHLHEPHTRYVTLQRVGCISLDPWSVHPRVHCQTNCWVFVVSLSIHQAVDKMSMLRVKQIKCIFLNFWYIITVNKAVTVSLCQLHCHYYLLSYKLKVPHYPKFTLPVFSTNKNFFP